MKKFLAGSAIASIYTTDGKLIAISNTQINDTINLSVESQEVRSGYGNALDYIYYHSTRMEGQLEDAQFNLDYIKHNLGAKVNTDAFVTESKVMTLGATNTISSSDVKGVVDKKANYVWAYVDDIAHSYPISNQASDANEIIFQVPDTDELFGKEVCIKYSTNIGDGRVKNLTISANFIPDIVKIVLEAQLFASESGAENSSRIGRVLFTIPKAQLSGTQEISMSASGVASTPLSYLALKADEINGAACSNAAGVYGYITEILESGNWYNGVDYLAIAGDEDGLRQVTPGTTAVLTYAIGDEANFLVRPADRLIYGVKHGENAIAWSNPEATVSTSLITADGILGDEIAVGDTVYVTIGHWDYNATTGEYTKVVDKNVTDTATIVSLHS